MESKPDPKFLSILEKIRLRFAFLFRRGFQMVSAIFLDQNYEDWQVTMAADHCIIKIYSYTGKVGLALSIPQLHDAVGFLELNDLIDGISENMKEPSTNEAQNLERVAWLLEQYIDEVLEKIESMLMLVSIDDPTILLSRPGQSFRYN